MSKQRRVREHRPSGSGMQNFTAGMSILMVLLVLGLVVFFGLTARNLSVYVRENIGFSILLSDEMREGDITKMKRQLDKAPYVKQSEYISKKQALKEQTEAMGTDPAEFLGYNPFKPSIGAPPYLDASKSFKVSFNAGFTSKAPILLRRELIIPVLILLIKVPAKPSYSFKITLPTKASHTTTSAYPAGISLASMLPIKLISLQFLSNGKVSFTSAFPFSSSAPIFTIATRGFLIPMTCSI